MVGGNATRVAAGKVLHLGFVLRYDPLAVRVRELIAGGAIGKVVSANVHEETSKARLWEEKYRRTCDHGTAFEGSEGWIHVDRGGLNAHPRSLLDVDPDSLAVRLPRSGDHGADFIESVRSRRPPISNIDEALKYALTN